MDFKGLNVAQVTELRRELRDARVSMRVVKNTLAKRALREVGIEGIDSFLAGETGIIWSEEDSVTPARVLLDFIKKHNKGVVKAGLADGTVVDGTQVIAISKLPTKMELYAQVASVLNAPIVKLARVLNAVPTKFVRTVDALREQKSGSDA
jgi:large subunit ribosomal protein L10